MLTDAQLSDFLAGKLPLEEAEEIERLVRESAAVQARIAELPLDPLVDRLRKVWQRRNPRNDEPLLSPQASSTEPMLFDVTVCSS